VFGALGKVYSGGHCYLPTAEAIGNIAMHNAVIVHDLEQFYLHIENENLINANVHHPIKKHLCERLSHTKLR
jgi:hypothetical protein